MFLEATSDDLKAQVEQHDKVMVQYGATWCGNCKITKPKFKRFSRENEDILFVYVDAEKYPNSRKLANVSNLPTFASFSNGVLVEEAQGNKIETIEQVLNAIANN
ncbi:thioredoxin family protein [Crocinitomicaceae bacterium]|mgnify:FL=1|nr:thioredoxin family protein [Crocinitomicaceae bacterium]